MQVGRQCRKMISAHLTLTIAYPEITVSESEWDMQTSLGTCLFPFIIFYLLLKGKELEQNFY